MGVKKGRILTKRDTPLRLTPTEAPQILKLVYALFVADNTQENYLISTCNSEQRLLLGLPRSHSARQMFASINEATCQVDIRNLISSFISSREKFENRYIKGLINSDVSDTKFTSALGSRGTGSCTHSLIMDEWDP